MTIIQLSRKARSFFPLAPRTQRARQAVRLALAKEYLQRRNIAAIATGSAFQYARSTASIL